MAEINTQNVQIYLVDDDELQLKIIRNKFLTSTDYQLRTFTSGEEFLETIIRKPLNKWLHHIVILDFQLHSTSNHDAKNGLEILQILKGINPAIQVIMLSGVSDEDIQQKATRFGAVEFIRKNENSFTRINNAIKWIISSNDLKRKQRASKMALGLFLSVLGSAAILVVTLYLLYPDWFKV
ncbi:MAG: hypothetical protein A2W91_14965 [Bacteroidetes bacterium GWF2_38_335]|nr:MAG: hypothetical protein A2W91_14965 [Bacteroidetes bacterium GWF2_38_335]OFY78499.1 MAG: hypothetical protein A2281_16275 [Bacteroidetes bacterium RIFOXYA12_FULL_38_20]HBS88447.1 hypothetical protein [Bacteroidales bacterium]